MGKIPVGETISGAYGFAFAGFLTVLGTVWLPYVAFIVFCAGVIFLLAPDLPGQIMRGEFDASMMYGIWRIGGLIWLASIIVRSMVTVGLQERALGRAQGPAFFYFSLGAAVWRMIGAIFLAILALILIGLLTAGVTAALSYASFSYVPNVGKALAVILCIVAVCWMIYACVRLVFFLPAVVVAEDSIGLGRSWELGGGNFWRMFAVWFVVFVPVAIGLGIVRNALVGPFMPMHFPSFHPGMTPDDLKTFYAEILKSVFAQMRVALPFFIAIGVVQEIIYLGLANGMIAKAYLGVTGKTA
jgi:hypothetical protein